MTNHCHNADHNFSYSTSLTSDLEATGKAWEPLDNNKNGLYGLLLRGNNINSEQLNKL